MGGSEGLVALATLGVSLGVVASLSGLAQLGRMVTQSQSTGHCQLLQGSNCWGMEAATVARLWGGLPSSHRLLRPPRAAFVWMQMADCLNGSRGPCLMLSEMQMAERLCVDVTR